MAFDNPSDRLMGRNKALYYLALFGGFFTVLQFDNKIMTFLLGKLGGYIPYHWANILIARFIEYALAIYIFPMIISWIFLMIMERG